ncbi:MAG: Hint domain-containing protein, partial [Pseudomonadota bacterium]
AIATPDGERRVEHLRIGDRVLTGDGRAVPARWIGRQTVSMRFQMPERLLPVRIRAGALGNGLPARDLTLTADHALLIDGLLINAGALVNGSTIDWVPVGEIGDSLTVYHVETEDHDIILAEGTPSETFIDFGGRRAFDNFDEYIALYGAERTILEMRYPRVSARRLVPPSLKERLAAPKVA